MSIRFAADAVSGSADAIPMKIRPTRLVGRGEGDEGLKLCQGCAGVDCLCGLWDGFAQMIRPSGGDEGGGGVEQYDVAACGFFPGQDFANQRGIKSGISAGDFVERGARQAKFLGRNFVGVHLAFADFPDARWTGYRDFVQSVAAVDYQRTMQS